MLPFIIFCVGFLKPIIGIPVSLIILWIYWRIIRQSKNEIIVHLKRREILLTVIIISIWVWLSGIGGFAFQNWDHHFRNALFRDLINYSWPVYYSDNMGNLTSGSDTQLYTLVYYIGFWLPSALVGKVFGWQIANFSLFIWSVMGITLTTFLLKNRIKASLVLVISILIIFSGMDIIGMLLRTLLEGNNFQLIWPPQKHLEWWSYYFQFSSFTTQLFWVFNQAIPTWICMALLLTTSNRNNALLLWGLCLFFTPITALGMLPFTLLNFLKKAFNPAQIVLKTSSIIQNSFIKDIWKDIIDSLSIENIVGGGSVICITLLFFMGNHSVSLLNIEFLPKEPIFVPMYILFILFEGILLWTLFNNQYKNNIYWYVVGISLVICPLFSLGTGINFGMRISIPALFILMVWSLEKLVFANWKWKPLLIIYLIIGAMTPLYEINRSIYRTFDYLSNKDVYLGKPRPTPQQAIVVPIAWEKDHPYTLVADDVVSFSNLEISLLDNYISSTSDSLFLKSLIKKAY